MQNVEVGFAARALDSTLTLFYSTLREIEQDYHPMTAFQHLFFAIVHCS